MAQAGTLAACIEPAIGRPSDGRPVSGVHNVSSGQRQLTDRRRGRLGPGDKGRGPPGR